MADRLYRWDERRLVPGDLIEPGRWKSTVAAAARNGQVAWPSVNLEAMLEAVRRFGFGARPSRLEAGFALLLPPVTPARPKPNHRLYEVAATGPVWLSCQGRLRDFRFVFGLGAVDLAGLRKNPTAYSAALWRTELEGDLPRFVRYASRYWGGACTDCGGRTEVLSLAPWRVVRWMRSTELEPTLVFTDPPAEYAAVLRQRLDELDAAVLRRGWGGGSTAFSPDRPRPVNRIQPRVQAICPEPAK